MSDPLLAIYLKIWIFLSLFGFPRRSMGLDRTSLVNGPDMRKPAQTLDLHIVNDSSVSALYE